LPHKAAIALPLGQLDFSGGNLQAPVSFAVTVTSNNALVKLPGSSANPLTGSINPKTGQFTVKFGGDAANANNTGTGVVLQGTTNGGGFFLGATNAGSIILRP
jgi:hypothetical protein